MKYYELLNLTHEPFANAPDPDFFFPSFVHHECIQKIELAVRLKRGLNVICGRVGTGKTTICRALIRRFADDPLIRSHLFLDPVFASPSQFLSRLAAELTGEAAGTMDEGAMKERLKQHLFESCVDRDIIPVVIIDEGQKLPGFALEILRELLNYETNDNKLLQIIIFAQPEFEAILQERENVKDRINLFYRLGPLTLRETRQFIKFRINKASDGKPAVVFTLPALWRIHTLTGGYPRKIINLCHQAVLALIIQNKTKITRSLVDASANRALNMTAPPFISRRSMAAAGVAGVIAVLGIAAMIWFENDVSAGRNVLHEVPVAMDAAPALPLPLVSSPASSPASSLASSSVSPSVSVPANNVPATDPRPFAPPPAGEMKPVPATAAVARKPEPITVSSSRDTSTMLATAAHDPLPPVSTDASSSVKAENTTLQTLWPKYPKPLIVRQALPLAGQPEPPLPADTQMALARQPDPTTVLPSSNTTTALATAAHDPLPPASTDASSSVKAENTTLQTLWPKYPKPLIVRQALPLAGQPGSSLPAETQMAAATPALDSLDSDQADATAPPPVPRQYLGVVTVTEQDTLYDMIRFIYGDCTPARIETLQRINRHVTNPDIIDEGIRIKIPVLNQWDAPLTPGFWVAIGDHGGLNDAYAAFRRIHRIIPETRLLTWANAEQGLTFSILIANRFESRAEAETRAANILQTLGHRASVISAWGSEPVFFTPPWRIMGN